MLDVAGGAGEDFPQLIQAAQDGDRHALGAVLEPFRGYLRVLTRKELNGALRAKADPADLVQQTFLEAQHAIASFRGREPAELRAWLVRILRHNVYDFVQRFRGTGVRQIDREVSLQVATCQTMQGLLVEDSLPCENAQANEELELLAQAFDQLPCEYRGVLRWRHCADLSFSEIGKRLGLSENAARKLWVRAIEKLRQHVDFAHERDDAPCGAMPARPR